MVRRAARYGREQFRQAREQLQGQGRAPATAAAGTGQSLRDQKLAHGLQVILVQSKVVKQQLATDAPDAEQIARALETIDMTAASGLSSLKQSSEPLSGTVVD